MCDDQKPNQVYEHDPADVLLSVGNRPETPETPELISDLVQSIRTHGQQVPGVVHPHPTKLGKWTVVAGYRRLLTCRFLGIPFLALRLPAALDAGDLAAFRLTENVLRKAMTPREIAIDLKTWIEAKDATQAEAAADFGFSAPKVSKFLSLLTLPECVQAMIDSGQLCTDAGRIIASLPTPELQIELAQRAFRENLKRDAVERIAVSMRGIKRPVPVRDRKIKDGPACISYPGDWSPQKAIEWLSDFLKRLRKRMDDDFGNKVPA